MPRGITAYPPFRHACQVLLGNGRHLVQKWSPLLVTGETEPGARQVFPLKHKSISLYVHFLTFAKNIHESLPIKDVSEETTLKQCVPGACVGVLCKNVCQMVRIFFSQ